MLVSGETVLWHGCEASDEPRRASEVEPGVFETINAFLCIWCIGLFERPRLQSMADSTWVELSVVLRESCGRCRALILVYLICIRTGLEVDLDTLAGSFILVPLGSDGCSMFRILKLNELNIRKKSTHIF